MEIYRLPASKLRIDIPLRDNIPVQRVRIILSQARLTATEIERFLEEADGHEKH